VDVVEGLEDVAIYVIDLGMLVRVRVEGKERGEMLWELKGSNVVPGVVTHACFDANRQTQHASIWT